MKTNALEILVDRILRIITEWQIGDVNQFNQSVGRMEEIKHILKVMEVTTEELIGGLQNAEFIEKFASKLTGGNRA